MPTPEAIVSALPLGVSSGQFVGQFVGQLVGQLVGPFVGQSGVLPTLGQIEPHLLVNVWKPLFALPPVMAWGWMVSTIFDKQAHRFFLGREKWNGLHLGMGFAAVAAFFLMPVPGIAGFFAGFGAMVAILAVNIVLFIQVTNRDERVPEDRRIDLLRDIKANLASRAAKSAQAKLIATVALDVLGPGNKRIDPPQKETPEYDVRVKAEQFFLKAIASRAASVVVQPTKQANQYGMQLMIDGVGTAPEPMESAEAMRLTDFWKGAAGLEVNDRRRKLVGQVSIKTGADSVPVRITTSGSQSGIRFVMAIDPVKQVNKKADAIGFLPKQLETMKELVGDGTGVVLLSAPPEQGKTQLLYAVTRMHDSYTSNVQTLELDRELELEGTRQNVWVPGSQADYSTTTRSLLRRDPDVLTVAELLDTATAGEIIKADHSRTRTYVGLPLPEAIAAVQYWLKTAGGQPAAAAECLRGAVAGRSVRKLCENCRQAYQPPADMLGKLGLPADKVKQLFKKGGQVLIKNKPETCPVCQGHGFVDQVGIFEVFPIDADGREAIAAGNWKKLMGDLRKAGHVTLQEAGFRKAIEGVTSIEEVLRVLRPPAAGPTPGQPGAPSAPAGSADGKAPAPKAPATA